MECFKPTLVFFHKDKKVLSAKEGEAAKALERLKAVQEEGQKDAEELEAAQQHFKAVSAGLSANEDGEAATLAGQMMTCKNDISKAETEAKQVTFSPKGISGNYIQMNTWWIITIIMFCVSLRLK